MATGTFEEANEIAVLQAGQAPEWQAQPTAPSPLLIPTLGSNGVALQGSLATRLAIDLRENPGLRTVRLTFPALDLLVTDYLITIDGTTATFDASVDLPADLDALCTDVATVINAASGTVVTATPTDTSGDGDFDTVVITGDSEDHYTISVSAVSGTGSILAVADADSAVVQAWSLPTGSGTGLPTTWRKVRAGRFAVDAGGKDERLNSAGIDRLYGQVEFVSGGGDGAEITYAPTVRVGVTVLS